MPIDGTSTQTTVAFTVGSSSPFAITADAPAGPSVATGGTLVTTGNDASGALGAGILALLAGLTVLRRRRV